MSIAAGILKLTGAKLLWDRMSDIHDESKQKNAELDALLKDELERKTPRKLSEQEEKTAGSGAKVMLVSLAAFFVGIGVLCLRSDDFMPSLGVAFCIAAACISAYAIKFWKQF